MYWYLVIATWYTAEPAQQAQPGQMTARGDFWLHRLESYPTPIVQLYYYCCNTGTKCFAICGERCFRAEKARMQLELGTQEQQP